MVNPSHQNSGGSTYKSMKVISETTS